MLDLLNHSPYQLDYMIDRRCQCGWRKDPSALRPTSSDKSFVERSLTPTQIASTSSDTSHRAAGLRRFGRWLLACGAMHLACAWAPRAAAPALRGLFARHRCAWGASADRQVGRHAQRPDAVDEDQSVLIDIEPLEAVVYRYDNSAQ